MKNTIRILGIIILTAAIFGFIASCSGAGAGGNTDKTGTINTGEQNNTSANEPLVFESIVNGEVLQIIISREPINRSLARSSITPKNGDYYEIIHGNKVISKGIISSVSAADKDGWSEIVFTPSSDSPCGNKESFTGTVNPGDVVDSSGVRNGGKLTIPQLPYEGGVLTGIEADQKVISLMEMVQIPGGTLEVWEYDEVTDSDIKVLLTVNNFKMGKYEVTQEQYQAVMGVNPSGFSSNPEAGEIQGKRPVENVSWYDAIIFCNKLSIKEGLQPAYRINGSTNPANWGEPPFFDYSGTLERILTEITINGAGIIYSLVDGDQDGIKKRLDAIEIVNSSNGYRLPTWMQWGYAAGSADSLISYNLNEFNDYAWFQPNSNGKTHQVGLKLPNAFGLYDMYGNVGEWLWERDFNFFSGNIGGGSNNSPPPQLPQLIYSGQLSDGGEIVGTFTGGDWKHITTFTGGGIFRYGFSFTGVYEANSRRNSTGFRVVLP